MEKRVRIYYSPETWIEVKRKACSGVSFVSLSRDYGMSRQAIRNRSIAESWPLPEVLAERRRVNGARAEAAAALKESGGDALPDKVNTLQMQQSCVNLETGLSSKPDSPISRFHAALMALVDSPPADFQAAFAGVAQAAIAEGLPEIPAPRSIKELATWFDLWRKAAGLDIKEKSAGITPLVNPMRTVSRRAGSQVIEAEPLPGTPEFDAWEV